MHKLAVYTKADKAIVGWTKDLSTAKKRLAYLGEGWQVKVSKREYYRRDTEVLLACYCVWWLKGYTLVNRSVPGTPLEKEVAMLKLLSKPLTDHGMLLVETLAYDKSVAAKVEGRTYAYITEVLG